MLINTAFYRIIVLFILDFFNKKTYPFWLLFLLFQQKFQWHISFGDIQRLSNISRENSSQTHICFVSTLLFCSIEITILCTLFDMDALYILLITIDALYLNGFSLWFFVNQAKQVIIFTLYFTFSFIFIFVFYKFKIVQISQPDICG